MSAGRTGPLAPFVTLLPFTSSASWPFGVNFSAAVDTAFQTAAALATIALAWAFVTVELRLPWSV